jgi:hypothetical protein
MQTEAQKFQGIVTSINYVINSGIIEYLVDKEKQHINFFLSSPRQFEFQKHGFDIGGHHFWVRDVVGFKRKLKADGKFIAYDVIFKYNTALKELLDRAKIKNHFFGEFIKSDDQYFVKELLSEIILPLEFVEYEAPPVADELLRKAYFRINNMHDSKKRSAELIEKRFININDDFAHHLKLGTAFDAHVTHIRPKFIELTVPFFSITARLDTFNCKEELKRKYFYIQPDDKLRVKLHHRDHETIYVNIVEFEASIIF